ncbi:MAG: hypothetical protein ACTSP4_00595 [Candidatus Hodarchaeales archaeon]
MWLEIGLAMIACGGIICYEIIQFQKAKRELEKSELITELEIVDED